LDATVAGIITVQAILYFQRYPGDRIATKAVVGFLWLLELFQVAASTLSVYSNLIGHFYIPSTHNPWYNSIGTIITVISVMIVQLFFVYRLHQLSALVWLPVFIVITTFVQTGMGLVSNVKSFTTTHFTKSIIHQLRAFIITSLVLGAANSLVIALSLSFSLWKSRTGFSQTDSVLRKLSIYAINTGALTSVMAMTIMISVIWFGSSSIQQAFGLPLGGVYTACLLANFHSRSTLRRQLQKSEEPSSGIRMYQLSGGVQVHKTFW